MSVATVTLATNVSGAPGGHVTDGGGLPARLIGCHDDGRSEGSRSGRHARVDAGRDVAVGLATVGLCLEQLGLLGIGRDERGGVRDEG